MTDREQITLELEATPDEVFQAVLTLLRAGQCQSRNVDSSIEVNTNATPSFFNVAKDLIGAGEGPGDISNNPNYIESI
ncbi:hypothetical protein IQ266_26700 [filamentous cyanobacterium LEGE 11480]|uniref:Uncharacterized protein n=1 Tax=Romeriopsis navalis LEGE 11480 TaxID=2777977 RepID=A0A928VRC9_9CYAN|nr:hypothetical protein [Romeriopsis navalis]MBE9033328.1 hypothetical protein [Romeriopsis navalis LEGE 11480]